MNVQVARYALVTSAAAILAVTALAVVSGQQGNQSGYFDEYGDYYHDTPDDIGVEAIENVRGSAADGDFEEVLGPDEIIRIPQVEGVFFSEDSFGYRIVLPNRTVLRLPTKSDEVQIFDLNDRDKELIDKIFESIPRRRPIYMD